MDQCNRDLDSICSDNIYDLSGMGEFEIQQLESAVEPAIDMGSMCNNIDIGSNLYEDLDLGSILTSDANPMLANFSQGSIPYSSSQTKYIEELPIPADENSRENYYSCSQQSLGFGLGPLVGINEDVCSAVVVPETLSNPCLGVKRTASAASHFSTIEPTPQKRSKLFLNINKSQISSSDVMNTPDIIDIIDDVSYYSISLIPQPTNVLLLSLTAEYS